MNGDEKRVKISLDELAREVAKKTAKPAPEELTREQSMQGQEAIRPFLTKFAKNPSLFFKGEPAHPDLAKRQEGDYLYHVTTLGNLNSILKDGLLAEHGGTDGAGQFIAAPVKPKVGAEFVKLSQGFVHASMVPSIVDSYAHEYDSQADSGDLSRAPVVLRFHAPSGFASDPSDKRKGAVKIAGNIAPEQLEFLSQEGWVSLSDSRERSKIQSNLQEILHPKPLPKSREPVEKQTPAPTHHPTSPSKGKK
jgi:hypothetical protein